VTWQNRSERPDDPAIPHDRHPGTAHMQAALDVACVSCGSCWRR
jgi:hypothetical protein